MRNFPRRFAKVAGAGNDLVLVDARDDPLSDPASFARIVCERHFGVGGDGLMLLEPSSRAIARARMFNPDGTEDFCGNGMRCVAAYLKPDGGKLDLESPLALHHAQVRAAPKATFEVTVDLVPPTLEPSGVPMVFDGERAVDFRLEVDDASWSASSVAVGTTHTVIYLKEPLSEADFKRYSPRIESHPLFPERTTVLWCVVVSPDKVEMRIWERGVGETLSCGTGTCAAVVVGRLLGVTSDRAAVLSAGGSMTAEWGGAGPVRLTGPARLLYEGRLAPGFCKEC